MPLLMIQLVWYQLPYACMRGSMAWLGTEVCLVLTSGCWHARLDMGTCRDDNHTTCRPGHECICASLSLPEQASHLSKLP